MEKGHCKCEDLFFQILADLWELRGVASETFRSLGFTPPPSTTVLDLRGRQEELASLYVAAIL